MSLRAFVIVLTVLFVSQPVIERRWHNQIPAQVALLIDRSLSMGLTGIGMDKIRDTQAVLSSESLQSVNADLGIFEFANELSDRISNDSEIINTPPKGGKTDIANALTSVRAGYKEIPLASIILLSDGANNSGFDPVRIAGNLGIPVWSIGVGSTRKDMDIMITSVTASPTVYKNTLAPIDISYRAVEAAGNVIEISLTDNNGRTVESIPVRVGSNFQEGTQRINLKVEKTGKQRYRANVTMLDDELTHKNNSRSIVLNILQDRSRILLMSGYPDENLGNLARLFNAYEHFELVQRTVKDRGFYEGGFPDSLLLAQTDLVIFHQYPVKSSLESELRLLKDWIEGLEIPICFIDGGSIDERKLRIFDQLLPIKINPGKSKLVAVQVSTKTRHSITTDEEAEYSSVMFENLPPLNILRNKYIQTVNSKVLLSGTPSNSDSEYPALIISDIPKRKSAAILMRDTWRWILSGNENRVYWDSVVNRLIKWLVVKQRIKHVELNMDSDIYSSEEVVSFTAHVTDENYKPFNNALLRSQIIKYDSSKNSIQMHPVGNGVYKGEFSPWGDGLYNIDVHAEIDGSYYGSDAGSVVIEPFSTELLNTQLNEDLLNSIGLASGGGYAHSSNADSLFSALRFSPSFIETERRYELGGKWWLLLLIISTLSIEWLIRIRVGML